MINLEPYKDPDEFMKNLGKEAFQERIDHAENSFLFEIRMLEKEFNLSDPEDKTKFHREIARKLCEFSEEVERENYIEAVAEKYHIALRICAGLWETPLPGQAWPNRWNVPNPAYRKKRRLRKTAGGHSGCCSPGWWKSLRYTLRYPASCLPKTLRRSFT